MISPETLKLAKNLPVLPLPWQPNERLRQLTDLSLNNWGMPRKDLDEIRAYLRTRYIITGAGFFATKEVLETEPSVFQEKQDQEALQRRFEQDILGLAPNDSSDGLRWWAASAGGSGGIYPIEPIADLVGVSPVYLNRALQSKPSKRTLAFLHFDSFLVPVMNNPLDVKTVQADHIVELSEVGEKVLEIALRVAEQGERS